MKKADVFEMIRDTANKYGFEFEQNGNYAAIRDGWDYSNSWVNFTIYETPHWDMTKNTVEVEVTVKAAISQMGGHPTVETLRKAAETISRAADLVEALAAMKLAYTVEMKEGE